MSEATTRQPDLDRRLSDGDPGDHDRFAHYILGRDPQAKITKAMITGRPLTALCGKRWVPSRDASRYPVCPECEQIKNKILRSKK